jgi:hypothetical protein
MVFFAKSISINDLGRPLHELLGTCITLQALDVMRVCNNRTLFTPE